MSWLLNKMFNATTSWQRHYWRSYMGNHMSVAGAQQLLVNDLNRRE